MCEYSSHEWNCYLSHCSDGQKGNTNEAIQLFVLINYCIGSSIALMTDSLSSHWHSMPENWKSKDSTHTAKTWLPLTINSLFLLFQVSIGFAEKGLTSQKSIDNFLSKPGITEKLSHVWAILKEKNDFLSWIWVSFSSLYWVVIQ